METKYYRVRYSDKDEEEYYEHELVNILQLRKDVDDEDEMIDDEDVDEDGELAFDEDYAVDDDGVYKPSYSEYRKKPSPKKSPTKKRKQHPSNTTPAKKGRPPSASSAKKLKQQKYEKGTLISKVCFRFCFI